MERLLNWKFIDDKKVKLTENTIYPMPIPIKHHKSSASHAKGAPSPVKMKTVATQKNYTEATERVRSLNCFDKLLGYTAGAICLPCPIAAATFVGGYITREVANEGSNAHSVGNMICTVSGGWVVTAMLCMGVVSLNAIISRRGEERELPPQSRV